MASMESELAALQAMTPRERKLHFITEEARQTQAWMDRLMTEYRYIGEQLSKVDSEIAKTFSLYRRELKEDIREARGRLQWLRTEYRTVATS